MNNKIYPCPSFQHLIHGADYNPEQWIFDKSVWDEDMKLMKLAGTNEMTVGIFSWAKLEPQEGVYDFSFLDEIIDKISKNGGKVILATPSGARPHWLSDKYPEVLRVTRNGQREKFRARHNHCFTSPVYRDKVQKINRLLAERYGNNPTVIAWHISNEYNGECHCPLCRKAFQDYLKEKYHNDIDELNMAYWTSFWSHTFTSFDQIDPPGPLTEDGTHGLNLDWHRFVTHQTKDFMKHEIEPLKELTPHLPVTTNMMFEFYDLNYHEFSDIIDFACWDSYPEWHNGDDDSIANKTSFWHDFYRTLKQKPYLLMESTPSLVNWKPFNKPKRPGMDVLSSLQAIAHGSDSVQYFQWRKGRGSSEKFHGAVVGHDGTENTRVFRSVQTTSNVLKSIDEVAGTLTHSQAAIIFDWENMWALNDAQAYANSTKNYYETCYSYHYLLWERGINCDIISPHADLSSYQLVIAPMLYMTDEKTIDHLTAYVHHGGTLYATYMLSTVEEHDLCHLGGLPAQSLKEVFGITAEEVDTLYPDEIVHASMNEKSHELCDYCEIIHPSTAEVLSTYSDGYYTGSAAVTINKYHKGYAIYQAARDTGSLKEEIMEFIMKHTHLTPCIQGPLPHGVTAHSRTDGTHTYVFVENYSGTQTHTIHLHDTMENMLNKEMTDTCTLEPYSFHIFKK